MCIVLAGVKREASSGGGGGDGGSDDSSCKLTANNVIPLEMETKNVCTAGAETTIRHVQQQQQHCNRFQKARLA